MSGSFVPHPEFAVTLHGVATVVDYHRDDMVEIKDALVATFAPHFGEAFADFVEETPTYFRVDAEKLYGYWRANEA